MDSFYDLVMKRQSIRNYSSKPVPMEDIEDIIETSLQAPSARNLQPWEIIIVQDEDRRKRLAEIAGGQDFVAEAPVIIAPIAIDPDRVMSCDIPNYAVDLSILVTHMMLAAAEKGLGTCWIGLFDQEAASEELDIPDEYKVFTLLPVGYPDEDPPRKDRKKLEEVTSWEKYGRSRNGEK